MCPTMREKVSIDGYLIVAECKECASKCVVQFTATNEPDEPGQQIEGQCWVDGESPKIFTATSCKNIKIEVA